MPAKNVIFTANLDRNIMKKRITEEDYIKANRRASREEEIRAHGKPLPKSKAHKSKKIYDRKKSKAGIKSLPFLSRLFK